MKNVGTIVAVAKGNGAELRSLKFDSGTLCNLLVETGNAPIDGLLCLSAQVHAFLMWRKYALACIADWIRQSMAVLSNGEKKSPIAGDTTGL